MTDGENCVVMALVARDQQARTDRSHVYEVIREFDDELSKNETEFFKLVHHGTPQDVENFCKKNKNELGLNKKDANLHTVLQIAVLQGNLEMVKVLFGAGCRDSFAVELAGALRRKDIVQFFINQPSLESSSDKYAIILQQDNKGSQGQEGTTDIRSEEEIRRMLKAAVDADDYKGIKLLVKGLQNLEALSLDCYCSECREKNSNRKYDKTDKKDHERLAVCHILSSPAYILVTARNPIWKALEWAHHLRMMAEWQVENKTELLQLAERSSKLAMELIPICHKEEDLKLLFEVPYEADDDQLDFSESLLKHNRLHDAIGTMQKEFIAHPVCQHMISKLWLGSYYEAWRKWSTVRRMLQVVWQILLMPFIFILFIFKVKFAKECLETPLNRFVYGVTSYSFFLVNVLTDQYVERPKQWSVPALDACDIIVGIWVLGHTCKIVTDCVRQRHLSYVRLWWIVYDAIMMLFFIAAGFTFIMGTALNDGKNTIWQLVLLSQGLYAIAMTLSCLRILQWLHLSSNLGPLVISFNRMNYVLQRFFVIFGIVVLSFSCGIYTVYKNFQSKTADDRKVDTFFVSYIKTLKVLFWAIFGKGDGNYASIPSQYHYQIRNLNITIDFQDSIPVIVGYTLWSLFHIAVVLILLNMLIALLTLYYQKTQDNADTEWKFACAKLQMYYIEKNSRFPPPFNIISLAVGFAMCLCNKSQKVDAPVTSNDDKLQEVVKRMIERYLHEKELAEINK